MKEVYGSMALDNKKIFTTDDIEALPEDVRAELIDGEIYYMASPSEVHQAISGELFYEIKHYITTSHKKCRAYFAPFGVFISRDKKNYVEPDIVVICPHENDDRLQANGCHGGPDWVIEVVSPSSQTMDYLRKLNKYQENGVREYWIVDPKSEHISVYHFGQNPEVTHYTFEDIVPVGIYGDFGINFKKLNFRLY